MGDVKRCPVCDGRGLVRESFNSGYLGWRTGVELDVMYRSCSGSGIIIINEPVQVKPITFGIPKAWQEMTND